MSLICVDFDGTVVTHEFPKIGKDIGAVPVLKALTEAGHQLILYTMRSGQTLADAANWFRKNEIPLLGVNCNPTQSTWSQSPKVFAHLYIDDATLGAPLTVPAEGGRPHIDWGVAEQWLRQIGALPALVASEPVPADVTKEETVTTNQ